METFKLIKEEILTRAKSVGACDEQYKRAYKSESLLELCQVIKDNFIYCCNNNILNGELIDKYSDQFAEGNIWHNSNVESGFLLASGSSTVEASGSSTVKAFDSSTVRAFGSSTVEASGSSTVRAFGSSTVRAFGSSTVEAFDSSTVRAFDSSTVRASGSSTIRAFGSSTVRASGSSTVEASGSSTVKAFDSSTVRAFDSSYINSYSRIECKISDKAILRYNDTIYTVGGNLKCEMK